VPIDVRLPGGAYATRDRVYLKSPSPIDVCCENAITVSELNVKNASLDFDATTLNRVRPESIHVNPIGYRPDDPSKRAFVSTWLGTGGPVVYRDGIKLTVVDDATGQSVFDGDVEKFWTRTARIRFG
jgi:endoglucanase